MTPDAETYLAKAKESLAAADADLAAGRYNAATSRAYYAAFQASVAMLIENGIRPRGDAWDHRFVISQFSGKLIGRRKIVPARYRGSLDRLLKARLLADYRPASVSKHDARNYVAEGKQFVRAIIESLEK